MPWIGCDGQGFHETRRRVRDPSSLCGGHRCLEGTDPLFGRKGMGGGSLHDLFPAASAAQFFFAECPRIAFPKDKVGRFVADLEAFVAAAEVPVDIRGAAMVSALREARRAACRHSYGLHLG